MFNTGVVGNKDKVGVIQQKRKGIGGSYVYMVSREVT